MQKSKIEWTDESWNPVTVCLKGCWYCWAKDMAVRFNHGNFTPVFHKERLTEPMKRKKPAKIFVCSASDLFGSWIPDEWILAVLDMVEKSPQHTFQFLTKNPSRYQEFNPWPENCWLGATATDQKMADEAVQALKVADAKIKFLSCEPLLSEIRLNGELKLDWVIVGALTGKKPKQPERKWVEQLTKDARGMNAALFYKLNLKGYPPIMEFPLTKR